MLAVKYQLNQVDAYHMEIKVGIFYKKLVAQQLQV